jgi:hypothetical protein
MENIKQIDFFKTEKGTKIKYRKRCEFCTSAKIDLITDDLVCEKLNFEFVEDDFVCIEFKLDKQIKQDIIDKCMLIINKFDNKEVK